MPSFVKNVLLLLATCSLAHAAWAANPLSPRMEKDIRACEDFVVFHYVYRAIKRHPQLTAEQEHTTAALEIQTSVFNPNVDLPCLAYMLITADDKTRQMVGDIPALAPPATTTRGALTDAAAGVVEQGVRLIALLQDVPRSSTELGLASQALLTEGAAKHAEAWQEAAKHYATAASHLNYAEAVTSYMRALARLTALEDSPGLRITSEMDTNGSDFSIASERGPTPSLLLLSWEAQTGPLKSAAASAAGCLKATDNSGSRYSKSLGQTTGTISLTLQPVRGQLQFAAQCAIKTAQGQDIQYKLSNQNATLPFTAAQGGQYGLVLVVLCVPSDSLGFLTEPCPHSDLDLPVMNGSVFRIAISS